MKIKELIKYLESLAPKEYSLDWDNCGIQSGTSEREIKKISIALTPTVEILEQAVKNGSNLLITHHPMIFKAIKTVNTDSIVGKMIEISLKNDLTVYTMHTNFDSVETGLNYTIAKDLGLSNIEILAISGKKPNSDENYGIGTIGSFSSPIKLIEIVEKTKKILNLTNFTYVGNSNKLINKVAICTGSGGSFINLAKKLGADLYITGDIKYHDAIDAKELDLALIDAGHHGTEIISIDFIDNYIKSTYPELEIHKLVEEDPFYYVF